MIDLKATESEWQLTPEEIRSVEGFEDATDEDVELIQSTFSLLTLAFYENYINGFGIEMTTSKEG